MVASRFVVVSIRPFTAPCRGINADRRTILLFACPDQPKSGVIRLWSARMILKATDGYRLAWLSLVLLTAVATGPAWADDTVLRLSETATIMVTPDEIAATLRAEALASNAQDAQRRVNEMMREAVEAAKKVAGITFSTGSYNVWRATAPPAERVERWQAGQSLNLNGKDGGAMIKLVGELQQMGLAQGSLIWRLSRDAERKARKDATKQALSALRGRADEAADIIGLRFSSFREVRLDSVAPPPVMPRPQALSRAALAAPAPPPSAEAEDVPVSASAEADILLKPR
jgi:predicted secreted protein